MIKRIAEAYKRWRHTRTFGIHSPLAYYIMREVVNQPYAYYGYDLIEAELEHLRRPRRVRSFARLLLRLSNFLQPSAVYISPSAPDVLEGALKAGKSDIRILRNIAEVAEKSGSVELVIDTARTVTPEILGSLLSGSDSALLLVNASDEIRRMILSEPPAGITFWSPAHILVFLRKGLPCYVYSVNFPF